MNTNTIEVFIGNEISVEKLLLIVLSKEEKEKKSRKI